MTCLCRAVYNPYIFNLCVSNTFPLQKRAAEVCRYMKALQPYIDYSDLKIFSYEEYVRTGIDVQMFDDEWVEETAIRNNMQTHVTSLLLATYIQSRIFNLKEDNEKPRDKLACMALVLKQPITVRKLQVETLGILPSVSRRLALFQDVRGKKKKYWRHLN